MPPSAHDLTHFVEAQRNSYAPALAEIRAGRKRTHWMWHIFPQIAGLGFSALSRRYAIRDRAEAESYLNHPLLGARLRECTNVLLAGDGRSAHDIFGSPDDLKLRSCATLFASVSPDGSIFHRLLDTYFQGEPDRETLRRLGLKPDAEPRD